jgi:hypothetical protein
MARLATIPLDRACRRATTSTRPFCASPEKFHARWKRVELQHEWISTRLGRGHHFYRRRRVYQEKGLSDDTSDFMMENATHQ